jgi:hypothetical protein
VSFSRAKFREFLQSMPAEGYPSRWNDQPNEIAAFMQYAFWPNLRAYFADAELYAALAFASENKADDGCDDPLTTGECLAILNDLEYA